MARPGAGWRAPYQYRVYGRQLYGIPGPNTYANPGRGNAGQLLFVTDESFEHFDAVDLGPGPAPGVTHFDTTNITNDMRYSRFQMPFLNVPGFFAPPVAGAPVDILPTDNGIRPGAPGHVAYGRPADDPAFRLPNNHALVNCYEHDRDPVETRPGFGRGRMPILASLLTMGAWAAERGPPGVDVAPASFENWLTTSGTYRPPNQPLEMRQGKYATNKAKLIDEWTAELDDQDEDKQSKDNLLQTREARLGPHIVRPRVIPATPFV